MNSVKFTSSIATPTYNKPNGSVNINFARKNIVQSSPKTVPFKGDINFVLLNKCAQKLPKDVEFKHISSVLQTLGVKELELGENLELARLLKSAMFKIKKQGFDIPTVIKCDSKYFENNAFIQQQIQKAPMNMKITIRGFADWDRLRDPILYFNPKEDWHSGNGIASKVNDMRHTIWHETGHYLHMKKHKNNPFAFNLLTNSRLDSYQKDVVRKSIGSYAADNSIAETIAEIFSRLVSGEALGDLHPEIFHIYSKYNGPTPKVHR